MASEELQDAVIRNVEVIGEAAKRVSPDTRGRLSQLDWRAICGMRDVLIHSLHRRRPGRSLERGVLPDTRTPGGVGAVPGRRESGLRADAMTSPLVVTCLRFPLAPPINQFIFNSLTSERLPPMSRHVTRAQSEQSNELIHCHPRCPDK